MKQEFEQQTKQQKRTNVLSMGPAKSGKTCIIKRFCEDRFASRYLATIGIDYGVKLHGDDLNVNFWDMSGDPKFYHTRTEFYKDVGGVFLVFDVSDRKSFDELSNWLDEANSFGVTPASKDITFTLCANKIDRKRIVTEEEGMAFASANCMTYFETSAQSGANVFEMFDHLFKAISGQKRSISRH